MSDEYKHKLVLKTRSTELTMSDRRREVVEAYGSRQTHRVVGPTGTFRKLALSSDGTTIAAVAWRTVCVWHTESGERMARLTFERGIEHAIMCRQGERLIVADRNNVLWSADITTGRIARVMELRTGIVAMSIDSADRQLAIADEHRVVHIVDANTFQRLATVPCSTQPVRLGFNADGSVLAAYGARSIELLETSTGTLVGRYGHGAPVILAVDAELPALVIGGSSGVSVLDAKSGAGIAVLGQYSKFDYTTDGTRIVAAGGGEATVWDGSNQQVSHVTTYVYGISDVKISNDQHICYVCGDDASVNRFTADGRRRSSLTDLYCPVIAASATDDDRKLVVVDERGTLAIYDLVRGSVLRNELHTACISKLNVAGRWAATGAYDGTATVLDLVSGREVLRVDYAGVAVQAVTLETHQGMLVTGNRIGVVQRHDVSNGRVVCDYHGNTDAVRSVCISDCRRYLLTSAEDGVVLVFDYRSGKLLNRMRDYSGLVYSSCFDPSGDFIVYGTGSGELIKTRAVGAGKEQRFRRHETPVRYITRSGSRLCSIGIRDNAALTDVETGEAGLQYVVQAMGNHRVAFLNGDGTRVVTGGQDGRLRFHDQASGQVLAELHHLGDGFLWTTLPRNVEEEAMFWTNRPDMIEVHSGAGEERTLLNPHDVRRTEYLSTFNNRLATMARVGMCSAAMKYDFDEISKATRLAVSDTHHRAMLEYQDRGD